MKTKENCFKNFNDIKGIFNKKNTYKKCMKETLERAFLSVKITILIQKQ